MRSLLGSLLAVVSCTGAIERADLSPTETGEPAAPTPTRPQPMPGQTNQTPPSSVPPATPGACDAGGAGPAPLRRLTRREYKKAVQRLLGVKVAVADRFIDDERLEPFFSNADSSPSDGVVDQYMRAAEEVAASQAKALADGLKCPAGTEAACGRRFVADFGRRAYRRPLTAEETARYDALFDGARGAGALEVGIQQVVQTMLQSPFFLYRVEARGPVDPRTGNATLDQHTLATRLAFFLTGAPPDEPLLAAADQGELVGDGLVAQARRLLATPDGEETVLDFHRHWLEVEKVARASVDPVKNPGFDNARRSALEAEANAFLLSLARSSGPRLDSLFTLDHLVNAAGERVTTPPGQRGGILTVPAVLAVNPRSVQRGRMVRELLLCQHVPAPPPDVAQDLPPLVPGQSPRQRWDRHVQDPACGGCHRLMDPIGFAFDHYDELGNWRDKDGTFDVDARGEIVGAGDADGRYDGAVALSAGLARSRALASCATEQWLRYALGRDLADPERCALPELTKTLLDAGLDTRALLVAIASAPVLSHVSPLP